jgi:uncharacterized protein (UPF0332 family)
MNPRYKRPDNKNALSILKASKDEMDYTLTLEVNEKSASTIIRNIYECFRMLGDSLLVSKGVSSQDHIVCINELTNMKVNTSRPLGLLNNLRMLRHNINYYGYKPNIAEVEDTITLSKALFDPLFKSISQKINGLN